MKELINEWKNYDFEVIKREIHWTLFECEICWIVGFRFNFTVKDRR